MKAFITGGAGFIGSHVAEALLADGHDVTVLDDLSQGKIENVPQAAHFTNGSVVDLQLVRELCKGMDWVCHCAAMSRVLPTIGFGPESTVFSAEQNILGTLHVLIAASEAKVKKLVYSASSTVYGNNPRPHSETQLPMCETPYAISKHAGELYALQFDRQYNLPVLCLRYFQVYGPREPTSGQYAMVRGIFLEQRRQGLPLTIHGDGSQRRDFVHVKDVAKANLLALKSPHRRKSINVGTGHSVSIKQLADMIGPGRLNKVYTPSRPLDMKETLADTNRCEFMLNWLPTMELKDHFED